MFTFAIWDSNKELLMLARDRLGIKPLYYCFVSGVLCFASEIKALLKTGMLRPELNLKSVDQYVTLNYTIGPETILKDIYKLMPGHVLEYTQNGAQISQYWDYSMVQESSEQFEVCLENISKIIEDAVQMRLMSEVPLGAFLSGGVDSSVIVGVMSRLLDHPVKTFTVGYEDADEINELKFARLVAEHFKTEHHEFILKPQKFMDIVSKVVWHLDEPVAEFATIPLLLLSELAKQHVTVMLSGEGADEVFAGYPIYRYMQIIEGYRKLPALFLGGLKEGKYMDWLTLSLHERYLGNGSYFNVAMKDKLYTSELKQQVLRDSVEAVVRNYYEKVRNKDPIGKMLYLDTKTWLVEDLLVKADKMTMAHAIELRVPFLDHKLVEYAATIPSRMKVKNFTSKYIFKCYAKKFVPGEIVYRKKRGFPVPVKQWLRRELQSSVKDILLDRRSRDRGLFDLGYIQRMFDEHATEVQDYSKNLWNLLVLELWMRTFLDGGSV
jgi:asparagine synthase (glutamine-hydrolysing)